MKTWEMGCTPVIVLTLAALTGCGSQPPAPTASVTDTTTTESRPDPVTNKDDIKRNETANSSPGDQKTQNEGAATTSQASDPTLTAERYMELGLPDPKNTWTSANMARAARILAEVADRDLAQLPRIGSAKSGSVFARMTNDQNLEQLQNQSIPLVIRTGYALQFLHAGTTVSNLYQASAAKGKGGKDESTEMLAFTLKTATALTRLTDEVSGTLDKSDPTYAVRMASFNKMKAGFGTILEGIVSEASDPQKLTPETRLRVLKVLDQTLPMLVKSLPPKTRTAIQERLQKLKNRPEYQEHQQVLEPLVEKVNQAIEEATKNDR